MGHRGEDPLPQVRERAGGIRRRLVRCLLEHGLEMLPGMVLAGHVHEGERHGQHQANGEYRENVSCSEAKAAHVATTCRTGPPCGYCCSAVPTCRPS